MSSKRKKDKGMKKKEKVYQVYHVDLDALEDRLLGGTVEVPDVIENLEKKGFVIKGGYSADNNEDYESMVVEVSSKKIIYFSDVDEAEEYCEDEYDDDVICISEEKFVEKMIDKFIEAEASVQKTKETREMSAKKQIDKNKDAVRQAAKMELGHLVLNKLQKALEEKAPMMAKGYIQKYPAFSKVAIANLLIFASDNYLVDNEKASVLAEACMEASMQEAIRSFNIEEMLDKLIGEIPKGLITKATDKKE